jgi:hypothetical protein
LKKFLLEIIASHLAFNYSTKSVLSLNKKIFSGMLNLLSEESRVPMGGTGMKVV